MTGATPLIEKRLLELFSLIFVKVALVDLALLATVIAILTFASRQLGFSRADEITIVFCGSKKSLVSGLPIEPLLFSGHAGLVIIPLMVFHQIQLMVCASLARHYAAAPGHGE